MPTGRVNWYDEREGRGFITPDEGGKDVFVHSASLEAAGLKRLSRGQKVSYEVSEESETPRATYLSIG
jgi:CspA family cold shock protein